MGENKTTIVEKTVKSGVTFGSALAMVISYTTYFLLTNTSLYRLLLEKDDF